MEQSDRKRSETRSPLDDVLHHQSMLNRATPDSFSAFTSVSDALSLQQSVIGSPLGTVRPASEREVAAAIADAERKYRARHASTKQETAKTAELSATAAPGVPQQHTASRQPGTGPQPISPMGPDLGGRQLIPMQPASIEIQHGHKTWIAEACSKPPQTLNESREALPSMSEMTAAADYISPGIELPDEPVSQNGRTATPPATQPACDRPLPVTQQPSLSITLPSAFQPQDASLMSHSPAKVHASSSTQSDAIVKSNDRKSSTSTLSEGSGGNTPTQTSPCPVLSSAQAPVTSTPAATFLPSKVSAPVFTPTDNSPLLSRQVMFSPDPSMDIAAADPSMNVPSPSSDKLETASQTSSQGADQEVALISAQQKVVGKAVTSGQLTSGALTLHTAALSGSLGSTTLVNPSDQSMQHERVRRFLFEQSSQLSGSEAGSLRDDVSEADSFRGHVTDHRKREERANRVQDMQMRFNQLLESELGATPLYGDALNTSGMSAGRITPASSIRSGSSISEISDYDIDQVLKDKLRLEGRLESLCLEANRAMRERAELTAQLARTKSQLAASEVELASLRRSTASDTELQALRQSKARLEENCRDLKRQVHENQLTTQNTRAELGLLEESAARLQERITSLQQEAAAKETTISALKEQVSQLYVESQTHAQAKSSLETEVAALKGDLQSLVEARVRYRDQIQAAQDGRAQLQAELGKVQRQLHLQSQATEQQRLESQTAKQRLADQQQRVLKEKHDLARHLQGVQTEVNQREQAFLALEKSRADLDKELRESRTAQEVTSERCARLQIQLTQAETESERIQSLLNNARAEATSEGEKLGELLKRLTLSGEEAKQRDNQISELQQRVLEAECSLSSARESARQNTEELRRAVEERERMHVQNKTDQAERQAVDTALKSVRSDVSRLEQALRRLQRDLADKTTTLDTVSRERDSVRQSLEHTQRLLEQKHDTEQEKRAQQQMESSSALEQVELQHQQTLSELERVQLERDNFERDKHTLTHDLKQLQEQVLTLQLQQVTLEGELDAAQLHEERLADAAQQNENLRARLQVLEGETQQELVKHRNHVIQLTNQLSALNNETQEREKGYELQLCALRERCESAESSRHEVEQRLWSAESERQQTQASDELDSLRAQLQLYRTQLSAAEDARLAIEQALAASRAERAREIHALEEQLRVAETEVGELREEADAKQRLERKNKKLAMKLEKVKGKLRGVEKGANLVQQQNSSLEEALARRETSLVQLNTEAQRVVQDQEDELGSHDMKLDQIHLAYKKEKKSHLETRKKLAAEKGSGIKLRRQLVAAQERLNELQQEVTQRLSDVKRVQIDLGAAHGQLSQSKLQLQNKDTENQELNRKLDTLSRELEEALGQHPLVSSEIQALQTKLEQRTEDAEQVSRELGAIEQRHTAEISNLSKTIQTCSTEIDTLRASLATATQEKGAAVSEAQQLRQALKQSLSLQKRESSLPSLPDFDLERIEELINFDPSAAVKEKPLSALDQCLNQLRGEIGELQRNMSEHTQAVHTSSKSWRSIESELKELRAMARTPPAQRTSILPANITSLLNASKSLIKPKPLLKPS